MPKSDLVIRVAGEAGEGVLSTGQLLVQGAARAGYRVQYAVPMQEIARTQLKFELGKNVVAVGVLAALFGMPEEYLQQLLQQRFGGRGQDILGKNMQALEAGLKYVREHIVTAPGFNAEQ